MSFLNGLFKGKEQDADTAPLTIYCPINGDVIPLSEIPDEVFSAGVLGEGFGIEPIGDMVYAPFNGTIIQISDTKHAVGVLSKDGIELLIHVGMDTVDMNGRGFQVMVKEGEKVKMGQPLLKFNLDTIKEAGHPATTAIVVTNSSDFSNLMITYEKGFERSLPVVTLVK